MLLGTVAPHANGRHSRGIWPRYQKFQNIPSVLEPGRHLREDLPRLVDAVMIPGMHIRMDGPLGLNEEVLRAALTALT